MADADDAADAPLDAPADLAVEIEGVAFAYPGAAAPALLVPRLRVARGERVLLVGPSGAGKSTLLNLVCGTLTLTVREGTVRVLGREPATMGRAARDRFRAAELGVVFQQFNLVPYLSVIDNVLLPMHLARRPLPDPAGRAAALLAALGLDPALAPRRASTLSVGQQQRVAAARACLMSPGLIVADEPTSALDADSRDGFLDLMFAQARETGAALLVVSHDAALAPRFERTVRLDPPMRDAA